MVSRMAVPIIFEAEGSKYYKRRSNNGPQRALGAVLPAQKVDQHWFGFQNI
jgi:hypothetical protein